MYLTYNNSLSIFLLFNYIQIYTSKVISTYLSIISKGGREDCRRVPKLNTTAYQNYYRYIALPIFNELPLDIK